MSKIITTLYTAEEGATKYRVVIDAHGELYSLEAGSMAALAQLIRDNIFRYGPTTLMLRVPGPQGYILHPVEGMEHQAKTNQRKWAKDDLYKIAVMALGASPAGSTWKDLEI